MRAPLPAAVVNHARIAANIAKLPGVANKPAMYNKVGDL